MAPSWFSVERLREVLPTGWVGSEVRMVEETASTIDLAWEWLEEGGPEGGVVIARHQTKGRGRLGRGWASPAGGLWMSVIARPQVPGAGAGRLGIIMGVSAAEAVAESAGLTVGLKWPNDLVAEGRKLGGVLIETRVAGSQVTEAVLSLGVNVNVGSRDLPEEIRETATSILALTGRELALESVAVGVLNRLAELWPEALKVAPLLPARWRERDVLLGREVTVRTAGQMLRGIADGIDEEGRLVLSMGNERRTVAAGEVGLVRDAA
jgi:BirA family biotin operon repressor/biotin-[acetyl-CoA-carboxylase] ligase